LDGEGKELEGRRKANNSGSNHLVGTRIFVAQEQLSTMQKTYLTEDSWFS